MNGKEADYMKMFRRLGSIAAIMLVLAGCSTKPESIAFGKDHCHFCKMTIVDEKFGAELVTRKGKVYKFDDVKCLLDYYNTAEEPQGSFVHKLVVDFAGQGALIDVNTAHFLASPEIRSPMNGQVAAFHSPEAMDEAKKQWSANHLSWDDLTSQNR
jgi:copper chaperone NosL